MKKTKEMKHHEKNWELGADFAADDDFCWNQVRNYNFYLVIIGINSFILVI